MMSGELKDLARRRGLTLLISMPIGLLLFGAIEAFRIPLPEFGPGSAFLAIGRSMVFAEWLSPALALIAAAGLLLLFAGQRHLVLVALLVGAALLGAFLSYNTLISYYRFEGDPLFAAVWGALGIGLVVAYALAGFGGRTVFKIVVALTALSAALLMVPLARQYEVYWPSLHLSLATARLLLVHASVALFCSVLGWRAQRLFVVGALAVALLVIGGVASALEVRPSLARTSVLTHTTAGYAAPKTNSVEQDRCIKAPDLVTDLQAEQLLSSMMPELPEGIRLGEMDVVLVMADSVRFDQTSLAGLDTTPTMAALAEEGAFVFTNAYAPASRTWLSVAAMFGLGHPSQLPLTTRIPPWLGEVALEMETVAEVYTRAGYRTMAFRYDFDPHSGLNQGFQEIHAERWDKVDRTEIVDRNITVRAIEQIGDLPVGDRHFTWVFMASTHALYLGRDKKLSTYHSALSIVDGELGRLVTALRRAGRWDQTILIVTSDHGEEFGEHGRSAFHGVSLFEEVARVPLLVRIPGVTGRTIDQPTSVLAVFPWLMLQSGAVTRAAAMEALRSRLAPVWRAVNGGVVLENFDATASYFAIVSGSLKVHFDLFTDRRRVYNLDTDPGERVELTDVAAFAWAEDLIAKYRRVRACTKRARLTWEQRRIPVPRPATAVEYLPRTAAGRAALAGEVRPAR